MYLVAACRYVEGAQHIIHTEMVGGLTIDSSTPAVGIIYLAKYNGTRLGRCTLVVDVTWCVFGQAHCRGAVVTRSKDRHTRRKILVYHGRGAFQVVSLRRKNRPRRLSRQPFRKKRLRRSRLQRIRESPIRKTR